MTQASLRDAALRTQYGTALAALRRARNSESRARAALALESAAAAYAATAEGAERISGDLAAREQAGDWDGAALLGKALQRGQGQRAARAQARTLLRGDTATQAPARTAGGRSGPPEPISWTPAEPVWPKRDAIDAALAATRVPPAHAKDAYAAYRALYQQAWRAMFPRDPETGVPGALRSNREGWEAREGATVAAARGIAGAELVQAGDLRPGFVLHNGYGIRAVLSVEAGERVETVGPGGGIRRIGTVALTYRDGRRDTQVPADQALIRLPALEQPGEHPRLSAGR